MADSMATAATARGRLTINNFGFSMPVDAPLYQEPPFYYRDAQFLSVMYETDEEAALDLVPEGLELALPATARVGVAHFPFTTFGQYEEAFLGLDCLWQGSPRFYVVHIVLTSECPLAAGREIWGNPKKLAHVETRQENELMQGIVERPRGSRICTVLVRPERPVEVPPSSQEGSVSLRVIPSPEKGAPPSVAELVEVIVEYHTKEAWSGGASISFDAQSELDPWHKLPVKRVREGIFTRADLVLPHGKVIKRY